MPIPTPQPSTDPQLESMPRRGHEGASPSPAHQLLARGKLPQVALAASMRELLGAVHGAARNRRPFVPQLATAEARA